jgi:phage shock protein C
MTYQQPETPGPYQAPPKRLVRNTHTKMLGGVCSGVADYLGLDVTLVRLLTVLGAVLGFGSLIVAYVVMWILVPEG